MNVKLLIAVVLIVLGLGAVGVGIFKYLQGQKPNSGLKIETNPPSIVFIDNVQMGQTPFDKMFKAGEVSLRLVPTATVSALAAYQTKVHLTPQFYTVVHRDFGSTDIESAGETISMEPVSGKIASLAVVVTGPDSASVTLDGQPQGFSPLFVASVPIGDHQIAISAPGFVDRTISAQAVAGYKLSVNVKLASKAIATPTPTDAPETTPTPTPKKTIKVTPTPTKKVGTVTKIEIKDTPTGFLRVRETASTSAKEMGRVNPGDQFTVLETKSGWYKIEVELDATSSGWISAQYVKKIEE